MEDASLLSTIFSFVSVFYGLLVPLLVLQAVALLFIPSLMKPGAQPSGVGAAIFSYLMESVGILLMTVGALPTVISVLAGVELSGTTYFTLLVLFAAGGLLFLWHDNRVREIEDASRAVPATIFMYMFKIMGFLIVFLWVLSLFTTLMQGIPTEQGWWILPLVMIVYGTLLTWCTHAETRSGTQSVFRSITTSSSSARKTKKAPLRKRASSSKGRKR
ncbi:hypothetical protein COU76_05485 [Candidatus Peregrinibacteria bacterium CG10_big_fil_rev_8_21_14_0_10_49_10]|nr:MAG: hypothetical protein COU76_05485 [Candidatus Peregrinibacteria bacterium CG10_big_fil_rev_8_21_14_0_10_49_10]